MKSGKAVIGIAAAFLMMVIVGAADSDADPVVDETYYCYSNELSFGYGGAIGPDIVVEWSAFGYDAQGHRISIGLVEPLPSVENNWKVKFDPDDVALCAYVYVTQSVTDGNATDVKTLKVIILPLPESGEYKVVFYDGYTGAAVSVTIIDATGYVEEGKNHVVPPKPPVREGYSFIGWYVAPELTQKFDPTQPISSDMDIYAKWSENAPNPNPNPNPNPGPGPGPSPGATLDSIMVAGDYVKDYKVGDRLNTTGLTVIAKYTDGTMLEVTSSARFDPTVFGTAGKVTVNVTFQGKTASFDVNVTEAESPDVPPEKPDNPVEPEGSEDGEDNTMLYIAAVAVLAIAIIAAALIVRRKH